MTPLDIPALRRLLVKATPRPWEAYDNYILVPSVGAVAVDAGLMDHSCYTHLIAALVNHADALLAACEAGREAEVERDTLRSFMAQRGYRRCDIPTCNCPSFHGGHAEQRLGEIADALNDADVDWQGTILATVKHALATQKAQP